MTATGGPGYSSRIVSIAAAVFDMDGVIFDTEQLFFEALRRAAAETGHEVTRDVFIETLGLPRRSIPGALERVLGPHFPAPKVVDRHYDLVAEWIGREGPPLKPGVRELLDALTARGIPAAVATSTDTEVARSYLDTAGLLDRFLRVVGGDRVAAGKPSPDIFLHAAAELEAAPAEALVFEDAEIGIQAAVQAGMRVVMIPDVLAPTEELEALCYAVLPSLNTAAERIEELIA